MKGILGDGSKQANFLGLFDDLSVYSFNCLNMFELVILCDSTT